MVERSEVEVITPEIRVVCDNCHNIFSLNLIDPLINIFVTKISAHEKLAKI